MVAVIRYTEFKNNTNPAAIDLTVGPVVSAGYDFASYIHKHTFIAPEIGTGAGQTGDTTSNPTTGFLLAKFYGPPIQEVVAAWLVKNATPTHANANINFRAFVTGTADHFSQLVFGIDNSRDGEARLYLLDQGDDASTMIAAGDTVFYSVALGNT
jgi:hypothetical protein